MYCFPREAGTGSMPKVELYFILLSTTSGDESFLQDATDNNSIAVKSFISCIFIIV
jgi:hypothetical protein